MLIVVLLATASIAVPQNSLGRKTLRGLRGVKVSIDNFVLEAEQEGLGKSQLMLALNAPVFFESRRRLTTLPAEVESRIPSLPLRVLYRLECRVEAIENE
jgi:hypothetical protein